MAIEMPLRGSFGEGRKTPDFAEFRVISSVAPLQPAPAKM
jgi:hypothetical protein